MSARIEGMREVSAALQALTPQTERGVRRAVKRGALNVQNAAKRRAPVDTGRLRNSISHDVAPDGLSAEIGTNVEYAPNVEFGTQRQRAQPFLFPALEAERDAFLREVAAAVKGELGKR